MYLKNIYDLLDRIRKFPAKYGCHGTPTHLRSFLNGYYLDRAEVGWEQNEHFHWFHDWVANKYDYPESTSGWAYMIEDQYEDKWEAFALFFELLDEYRGIQHQLLARVDFHHEDTTDKTWRWYSRLKKVRGSFEAVEKPLPQQIFIRKMNLKDSWFSMLAIGSHGEVLFWWNWDTLNSVFQRAEEIFGIQKHEWALIDENKSGI